MRNQKPWRLKHGPRGARVTVGERSVGSTICVWAYDPTINGSRRRSLGYHLRDSTGTMIPEAVQRAKRDAATASNALLRGEHATQKTTVGALFDLFRSEQVRDMKERHAKETERELELLERFLGRGADLEKIGPREWNAIKRARLSGEISGRGHRVSPESRRPVSNRSVGRTLQTLRQVCRFGTHYRRRDGSFMLSVDPTRGLSIPANASATRHVATEARVQQLMEVADRVQTRDENGQLCRAPFRELLVLATETGRRIGSLVALRWSDWLPEEGTNGHLRFRAESDKLSQDWRVPVTPLVAKTLEAYRRESGAIGEAWIFPAPKRGGGHVQVPRCTRWLRAAEEVAGLPHPPRSGWHSFRRRFATGRKGRSLRDVAYLGGWKGTQVLQQIYQQPDVDGLEEALLDPTPVRAVR